MDNIFADDVKQCLCNAEVMDVLKVLVCRMSRIYAGGPVTINAAEIASVRDVQIKVGCNASVIRFELK